MSEKPISDLRQRMLEDMAVRKFGDKTRHDYIRHVEAFARFLGRSPDTATAEDVRRFQVHLTENGVQPPTLNSSASALRFFFGTTLDRQLMTRASSNRRSATSIAAPPRAALIAFVRLHTGGRKSGLDHPWIGMRPLHSRPQLGPIRRQTIPFAGLRSPRAPHHPR